MTELQAAYEPNGWPLIDRDQEYAAELVRTFGLRKAARHIGVSASALSAGCAGLPTYRKTHMRVREARLSQR